MAGGLNLYGFAGGDPVNFSDPFGLFYEYNEYGERVGDKGGEKEHYLKYKDQEYKLDRPLVPNKKHTPYEIHADGEADKLAVELANAEPTRSRAVAAWDSRSGGDLDFKTKDALKNPRQLFIVGKGAVHADVVGNLAWGYFARTKLNLSKTDAVNWAQRYALGHDDINDINAIKRAYSLPGPQ